MEALEETAARSAGARKLLSHDELRPVEVKPGHAAFTLMPANSRSEAKANVIALSAVFDEE